MGSKIILLLVLLVTITISTKSPHKIKPLSQVLAQIEERHEFGKGISALIQVTLQSADPATRVNELSDLLYEIKSNLESFNKEENQKCQEKADYCLVTKNDLSKNLEEKQEKLDTARADQAELRVVVTETEQALNGERANYEQASADLATTEQQLVDENTEYEIKNNDYSDLILACEEGIKLLRKMTHGQESIPGSRQASNFIQLSSLKQRLTQATKSLQQHKSRHSELGMISPVIAVLATIQNKAQLNWDDLMNVINLLQDILDRLTREQQQLTIRHNQVVSDLSDLIENLKEQVSSALALINIYEGRLADAEASLAELKNVIEDTQEVVNSLQQQLADLTAECDESAATCAANAAKRSTEIGILEELIEYFESQVRTTVGQIGN